MNKALFWDFDGTLSYPNKSFFTALDTALEEIGCLVDHNETAQFLEGTYSWKNPQVIYPNKTGEKWWETFFEKISLFCEGKNIGKADADRVCNCFREVLTDVSNYSLYEDAAETLKQCVKLGYKNYLVTNNYPEITENLKRLGIAQFFSGLIVSSHIGYEKPRKEFFDYAKELAGNPETGYVIGDNPKADIQGGKDAGFTTIAVHECKESMADFYLEELSQIFKVLN